MQSQTIDLDVLRDVREMLSDPTKWAIGEYALNSAGYETDPCDKLAVAWCGQGAIYACGVARGMPTLRQVLRSESGTGSDWAQPLLAFLDVVAVKFGFKTFIDANDRGGREAVLRVIESAISDLESGGSAIERLTAPPLRPIASRPRARASKAATGTSETAAWRRRTG